MSESLSMWVSGPAGDYQRLLLRVKELEEEVAELEKENAEEAMLIEELKAKLARYESPRAPSSAQRFKKESKPLSSKKRGAPNGHRVLKFSLRGVLRRNKDFASHLNSFDITPKGIQDIILRVGEACKNAYFDHRMTAGTIVRKFLDRPATIKTTADEIVVKTLTGFSGSTGRSPT